MDVSFIFGFWRAWDTGQVSEKTGGPLMGQTATHWTDLNRPGDDPEGHLSQGEIVEALVHRYNIKLRGTSV